MVEIEDTIKLVVKWHNGQIYGEGLPYVTHLMLVARHFDDPFYKTIALLHDILEDTTIGYRELSDLYGAEIALYVLTLTKASDENYFDYIARVAKSPVARAVKIADLKENIHYTEYCSSKSTTLLKRYKKALEILEI